MMMSYLVMMLLNGVTEYLHDLLVKNGCAIENIPTEWQILKGFMFPITSNNKKSTYLEVWKNIITNDEILEECRNVLDIVEICLLLPITNAKLERMFSRMKRVKSDWRSSLSRRGRLDTLLRISEEGPSIADFNPATSIDAWYADAV